MNKKLYTLIVYTPGEEGWHDRCGDYHSGKESELNITYYTENEKDDLARVYGRSKLEKTDSEINLLINGHNPNEPHDSLSKEVENELESELNHIESLADEYYYKHKAEKEKREEAEKQRKLQEQESIILREKKRQEDVEKAEFTRLQAKYGK